MDSSSLLRGFRVGPGSHTMWKAYVTSEGGLYLKPAADEGVSSSANADSVPIPISISTAIAPILQNAEMSTSISSESGPHCAHKTVLSQQKEVGLPPPMTEPLYANVQNVLPRAQAAVPNTPMSLSIGYKQRLERLQMEQEVIRRQLLHALVAERSALSSSSAATHSCSGFGHTLPTSTGDGEFAVSGRALAPSTRAGGRSRNVSATEKLEKPEKLSSNGATATAAAATTSRVGRALSATRARSLTQNALPLASLRQQQQQQECAHCRQCSQCLPSLASVSASAVGVSSPEFPHSHELRCSCRLPPSGELPARAHLVPLSVDYAFGGSADAGSTDSGNASGGASAPNSNHSHLVTQHFVELLVYSYVVISGSLTFTTLTQSAASPTSPSPVSPANASSGGVARVMGGQTLSQSDNAYMNVRAGASSKAAACSASAGDLRRQSIVEEDETSSLSLSGGGTLPADGDDASAPASAAVDVLALCKDGLSVLHTVHSVMYIGVSINH